MQRQSCVKILFIKFRHMTHPVGLISHSSTRRLRPPAREGPGERSSMTSAGGPEVHSRRSPHAQETTLCVIIVASRPESVLPDVLAMHTIEMIPKSMILISNQTRLLVVSSLCMSKWQAYCILISYDLWIRELVP